MEKVFNCVNFVVGVVGGILAQIFGGWDVMLKVLTMLIVLDYITGFIKASYLKQLSSQRGVNGILKKIDILIMVALANAIQSLVGDNIAIRTIVIMFLISNEGLSILENMAAMGVSLPPKLKDMLLQLRDKETK